MKVQEVTVILTTALLPATCIALIKTDSPVSTNGFRLINGAALLRGLVVVVLKLLDL